MRHEFSYNHRPALRLMSDSPVERMILEEMVEACEKGASVIFARHRNEQTQEPVEGQFVILVGGKE